PNGRCLAAPLLRMHSGLLKWEVFLSTEEAMDAALWIAGMALAAAVGAAAGWGVRGWRNRPAAATGTVDETDSTGLTQALLDAAVDAIIIIDSRGLVRAVNRAAERTFGYAA